MDTRSTRRRWYAATPAVRRRQLLGDLAVLAWSVAFVLVGLSLHGSIQRLAGPGRALEAAGAAVADAAGIGDALADLPLVGAQVAGPFSLLADAGTALRTAGAEQVEAVESTAAWIGLVVAGVPVGLVGGARLRGRLAWRREECGTRALLDDGGLPPAHGATAVLVLRAATHLPLDDLAASGVDLGRALRDPGSDDARRLARSWVERLGVELRP